MTIHELLNILLNANSVTNMLQYLKESDERAKKTGVYKTHSLISVRDLISICAIKIEKPVVHIEKMKALAENRKLYNMKELSERLGISRQTLYNWRDEGWLVMDEGKVHLRYISQQFCRFVHWRSDNTGKSSSATMISTRGQNCRICNFLKR